MTRFGWLVAGGVVVAMLSIALLLWGFARQSAPVLTNEEDQTPVVDPSTLSLYSSGEYGFSLQYPATARVDDSFVWRTNVNPKGTPIVRVTTSGGEVRIGASSNTEAVAGCEEEGPSEEEAETVSFGNATWQVFRFDELGTEDERRVTSYRTVRGEQCFALETYEPYTPVAAAPTEHPQFIVTSFTFAR